MAHGLTESIGLTHYKYDPSKSDETLFEQGYNRIYDTLEMESNLNDVERLVREVLNTTEPDGGVWSSARLCRALGARLSERNEGRGILLDVVSRTAESVFMPLCVGGGVSSLQDIRDLLNAGADKVSINTAAIHNPELVREAAQRALEDADLQWSDIDAVILGKAKKGSLPVRLFESINRRALQHAERVVVLDRLMNGDGTAAELAGRIGVRCHQDLEHYKEDGSASLPVKNRIEQHDHSTNGKKPVFNGF